MGLLIVPATILVLLGGAAVAVLLPLRGAIERLVVALGGAQLILTLTLLGAGVGLRRLDIAAVFIVLFVLLGSAGALAWRLARPLEARSRLDAALGELRSAWRAVKPSRLVIALAVVTALALAWRLILAIRLPVLDYDGVSYHLVTVDVWLQTDMIGRVAQRLWSDSYPANGELVSLWLMDFARTDALATLTGLLPLPLAALSVAGLARRLGANRTWAAVVGMLFVLLPVVIALANTTYVDNLAAADVAATWFLGVSATMAERGRRRQALLVSTGVAMGLAIGTKVSMLLPVGFFGLALILAAGAVGPLRARISATFQTAVELGIPALVAGGYWYVKDLATFGNPFWPFTVGPFPGFGRMEDLVVQHPAALAGMSPWRQVLTSWLADFHLTWYAYDSRIGGFGLAWFALLFLAIAGGALLVRSRRLLPILGIAIPAALIVATAPSQWWARYILFLPVIVLALAAVAMSRLPRRIVIAAGTLVLAGSMVSLGVVNIRSNLAASRDGRSPTIRQLVKQVVSAPGHAAKLGFWAECAGFDAMPTGARVSTDEFNLLHLVIGPSLDRTLAANISATNEANVLHVEAVEAGAQYLALKNPQSIAAATSDPAQFTNLGPVCRGVVLFEVKPG